MQIEFLDWPAAAAMIGIASTIGSYWLANRREEREDKKLVKRFGEFEATLGKLDELGRVHDKLLVRASAWMSEQDELIKGLVESTDAQEEASKAMTEASAAQDKLIAAMTLVMNGQAEVLGAERECLTAVDARGQEQAKLSTKVRDRQGALIRAVLFLVERLEHAESQRGRTSLKVSLGESIHALSLLKDEDEDEGESEDGDTDTDQEDS